MHDDQFRKLLTYHVDAVKAPTADNIIDTLPVGGLLIIGAHERLPAGIGEMLSVASHPSVFQKAA